MTDPAGILLGLLQVMLLLNWPVAVIIIGAAREKPYIWALNVMAVMATLVAVAMTGYVIKVANDAAGGPFGEELILVAFRLILVAVGLFPILFLWLYWTGRFRDGNE